MQQVTGAGRGSRGDFVACGMLFALITLFFRDVLFMGWSLVSRDLPMYHFPMKKIFRDLLMSGEFPYWTRLLHGGMPVAANPAWETFYPLQLPVLIGDYPFGFSLHIVMHAYLAAVGMYLLARSITPSRSSAFFAAAIFVFSAPYLSLIGTLPFFFSVAWMPWVFFFAVRFQRERRGIDFAGAAVALAMQGLIAEPFVFGQTALLLIGAAVAANAKSWRDAVRNGALAMLLLAAGLLLAAVQLLPGVDFARGTSRTIPLHLTAAGEWSLPPLRAAEILFPDVAGNAGDATEYFGAKRFYGIREEPFVGTLYLGLLSGVLLIAALLLRLPWWRFTAVAVALSVTLALGLHAPLFPWLFEAGLLRSLRYPEKFILSAFFVLTLFAGYAFSRLRAGDPRLVRACGRLLTVVALLAAVALALHSVGGADRWLQSFWGLAPGRTATAFEASRAGWWMVLVRCLVLVLIAIATRRIDAGRRSVVLIAFTLIDVLLVSAPFVDREKPEFYRQRPALLREACDPSVRTMHIAADRTGIPAVLSSRDVVWVGRNNLIPYGPGAWGCATVLEDDFDYTMLVPSRLLLDAADGARTGRDPSWPLAFMAISNAETLVMRAAPQEILRSLSGPPEEIRSVRMVRSRIPAPRYYFASVVRDCRSRNSCTAALREALRQPIALTQGLSFTPFPGRVLQIRESPSRFTLEVEASGRAFLVATVAADKYWSATIDGEPAPIVQTNIAYQGVIVGAGRHVVRFEYGNPLIATGAAVSSATLLALLLIALRFRGEHHQKQ